jgi:thiol-disulfide isomerase/thioredoxin
MPPARPRSRRAPLAWSLAIAAVGGLLLVLVLIPVARAPSDGSAGQLVGQPAPPLGGETLDGDIWRLESDDERLIWVNFWAIACPPCRQEMPAMQRLAEAHPDELLVVGVNWGEERGAVAGFAERLGIDYPILLDPRFESFHAWASGGWLPRHYFVRDGVVVREVVGELRPVDMDTLVRGLLGG